MKFILKQVEVEFPELRKNQLFLKAYNTYNLIQSALLNLVITLQRVKYLLV